MATGQTLSGWSRTNEQAFTRPCWGQGVSSYLFSPHNFVNRCHCLILSVPIISMNPNRTIIDFILLHEKFLQFDWLRAVVEIPAYENYKPFVGSSINK